MLHYLFTIWLLSKLVTVILQELSKIQEIPAFNRWVEKTVKPALPKFSQIISALVFALFSPFVSIWCYFIYSQKRQIAQNPETEPEQLRKLAKVYDRVTVHHVTSNPNTPPDVLLTLGKQFPRELLFNPVFDLMLLEDPNLAATMPRATLKSLMSLTEISVGLLQRSAAISNLGLDVAQVIAQHPKATEYVFERVSPYSQDAIIAKSLIERSSLSTVILENLAANDFSGMKQYLAQRSRLPNSILQRILQRAVENSSTQQAQCCDLFLRALVQYGSPQLQSQFMQQQHLPDSVLEALAEYGTRQIQLQIVQWFKLSVKVLENLQRYGYIKVQIYLAQRTDLPTHVLQRLYYDRRSIIRKQIAQHPNASAELLQDLARDANAQVRKIALRRLAQHQDSCR